MNELVLANRVSDWHRLKALVLDSVSSPITRRVYNLGLDEFIAWYGQEPRPGSMGCAPTTASPKSTQIISVFMPATTESASTWAASPMG